MKTFKEEIRNFIRRSPLSDDSKGVFKRRLEDFLHYLAEIISTPVDKVHLERIYETVNKNGETLFYSGLNVTIVDEYFYSHLYKSYNWLSESKRTLQNFFLYLYRKYDFPILTEEMTFIVDEHKQKPQKTDSIVPTRHDLLKLLQSLMKNSLHLERDALFFTLLISTGSRINEIITIKVKDIDYKHETIFVKKTKNGSSKCIVLREGFGSILKRYIEQNQLNRDDFLLSESGKAISRKEFQELFNYFLQKANLPSFTLHKLRHSFATIMAESGMGILVIQQLLGHKKLDSTSTYIDPNYIRNHGMELQVNKDIYKHIRKTNN
ncbi:tyrosine-type recombinase/integrase [Paraliobacillus sp. X-1268]|uniref:tyrosine-type recombinase/integrase n=1 Tax=Paraliobacillus sp. X-1268 TaxID=2213193 RepID=UPI00130044D9|nr:tyrosine-type recombinase/integrase [Paraliobacillus sp. X-1268]